MRMIDGTGSGGGGSEERSPDPYPFISVVVPTHHRPKALERCLAALALLEYPRDRFEVIVVDDGSPRSVAPVVARFETALDLSLVRQARSGPAAARNAGAAKARGRYLAFIDDDCQPEPAWLDALAAQLAETPDHMIGGLAINAITESPYAEASQLLLTYLYGYQASHPEEERFFASNNMAVSAEHFRSLGGFDARFPLAAGEDRDLCYRWTRRGYGLTFVPGAIVHHKHRMSLRGFWRQHFGYGRGAYYYHRAKVERGGPPLRVMGPSFYLGMLWYPLRSSRRARDFLHAILIGISQVANAVGYAWEASFGKASGRLEAGAGPSTPVEHVSEAEAPTEPPTRTGTSH